MTHIDHLRLKLITEEGFRKQLLEDPRTALHSVGITPTDDLLNILQELKKDLEELARILGTSIDLV